MEEERTLIDRVSAVERRLEELEGVLWEHQHDIDGSTVLKVKRG